MKKHRILLTLLLAISVLLTDPCALASESANSGNEDPVAVMPSPVPTAENSQLTGSVSETNKDLQPTACPNEADEQDASLVNTEAALDSDTVGTSLFSLNISDQFRSRTNYAYVSASSASYVSYVAAAADERAYLDMRSGATVYASKAMTASGYIDMNVRTSAVCTDSTTKFFYMKSANCDIIEYTNNKWLANGMSVGIANTGSWMNFRFLLKLDSADGNFYIKTLVKNDNGVYKAVTDWTNLGVQTLTGLFTLKCNAEFDISGFSAVTADPDTTIPKIVSTTKLSFSSAKIVFSLSMDASTLNSDTIKVNGNTIESFSYDDAEKALTITTASEILLKKITYYAGITSADGMPLDVEIKTTSVNVISCSIADGSTVSSDIEEIDFTLSAMVDPQSVNNTSVIFTKSDGSEINGIYKEDCDQDQAQNTGKIAVKFGMLSEEQSYTLVLNSGIKDIDGDPLTDYTIKFKTTSSAAFNFPVSAASATAKKIYVSDDGDPYMRITNDAQYVPNSFTNSVYADYTIRKPDIDKENFSVSLANYTTTENEKGSWLGIFSISGGMIRGYESQTLKAYSGDWIKVRIFFNRETTDGFMIKYFLAGDDGTYTQLGSEISTKIKEFNYTVISSSGTEDIRKVTYTNGTEKSISPGVLDSSYSSEGATIAFTMDMKADSFTSGSVKVTDSDGKVVDAELTYDAKMRCLHAKGANIAKITLTDAVVSETGVAVIASERTTDKTGFKVKSLTVSASAGGTAVTSLAGMDTAVGRAYVYNGSGDPVKVTVVVLWCSGNGLLKKTSYQSETVDAGVTAYLTGAEIDEMTPQSGDYVKIFVWNSDIAADMPSPTEEAVTIKY